jgi:hypothetical protein
VKGITPATGYRGQADGSRAAFRRNCGLERGIEFTIPFGQTNALKYRSLDELLDNRERPIGETICRYMPDDFYPQDITSDESALGFCLRVFEGLGLPDGRIYPVAVPVVAKILDASDILVKRKEDGIIFYSHQRFGRDSALSKAMNEVRPSWSPIVDPEIYAPHAIAKFESGEHNKAHGRTIVGAPFKYKDV